MPGNQEKELFIAALSGSAAGIDSIKYFLSSIHGDENCCVVIVPDYEVQIPENFETLLQKNCEWKVQCIEDGMEPLEHKLYIAPPGKYIEFRENRFYIIRSGDNGKVSPTDRFFISLAEEKKFMAIGILLSGPCQFPEEGIESINRNYGYVICQIPSSAYFRCLPPSVIHTDICDILLTLNDIFNEIKSYIRNFRIIKSSEYTGTFGNEQEQQIIRWLEIKTGINFSRYKSSSISRGIKKRMNALEINSIDDYPVYIRKAPKELDYLFSSLMIDHTEFFRDAESFLALQKELKKKILKNRQKKNYRIWCIGCGTGEEVYSIAMLLLELNDKEHFGIQIFASDIHEGAIKVARIGIYSKEKIDNIPEGWREKYFNEIPEGYEIKPKVKRCILFTRHDITDDAPFIRLDLIVCRNLLSYLKAGIRQETLKLFNYSLNMQGLLFLGKSENININTSKFFQYADDGHKIFEKVSSVPLHLFRRQTKHLKKTIHSPSNRMLLTRLSAEENEEEKLTSIIRETLLKTIEHPFILIDGRNMIVEVHKDIMIYFEPVKEWQNADILHTILPDLRPAATILLSRIKNTEKPVSSGATRLMIDGSEKLLRIKIRSMVYFEGMKKFYLMTIENVQDENDRKTEIKISSGESSADQRIRDLEKELYNSRNDLHACAEELEAANEEFQSLYAEIHSANEEYLATHMAFEVTNDEFLSANEELTGAVQELSKSNEKLLLKKTELKKLNEKLEESEKRFRYLADSAPVMIWMMGPDNKGNYFNRKWQEFTGMDLDKLGDDERLQFIHPDDLEEFQSSFKRAIENKIEIVSEFRMKGSDGNFQWFQMRGTPRYSASGEYLGYIGANTNIDEIKTLEEKKDEFMSIAGHELKTPMTTSLAYLELLDEEIRSSGNEKLKQYILKMANSMQKMHNLVVDLLEVSHIEADKLNLNLDELNFDEMVNEFVEDFSTIVPDRKITISGKTGKKIIGDRNRLEQVINNLVTNADKFSQKGKEIKIELEAVENFVKMTVKDQGIGIDKAHHKKIFKRYYQIGSDKFKSGMGVGLFISKEIVERHGGTIRIRSKEGKGSAFMVEIPAMN